MKFQKKYKIALVGYRLGVGGAERVMANLSIFLDNLGIETHIITVIDQYGYEYKGKVIATQKLKVGTGIFNRISRLIALKKIFTKEKYDFIIDFRFRNKPFQEFLIAKLLYSSRTIFTIHSAALDHYIPLNRFWAQKIYEKSFAIITVSNFIKDAIEKQYAFDNVQTIYNTVNTEIIDTLANKKITEAFQDNFILAVGQMDSNVKQFDHLLEAYHQSNVSLPLVICGEGKLKQKLIALAQNLQIHDKVFFVGFQENPYKYMAKAKLLVMSSAFEGFPNVLVESLYCEIPVISYDCYSGPNEIISQEYNGLLVENQNKTALANAIKRLLSDVSLYDYCKANARKSVLKFDLNSIGKQWLEVMKIGI
ncbi:glycosyltransferase [Flavobacterium sp. J27]|uniref:glycosyltransferase n=1 Tax=Flavobacterium sp. J27 TaxID=2060419 RepID=UPI001031374D|nr:glycosyltransferase [Flavobacterium sp. J27]